MNKRALMLTAAVVALLSGRTSAIAANCDSNSTTSPALCEINTVITTSIATSTVNAGAPDNISILAPGALTLPAVANATALSSALKIDSDNVVTNTNTTISYKNTAYAVGVEINAGNPTAATAGTTLGTYSGVLDTIDLTGSGTYKTGLLVDLPSSAVTGILNTNGAGLSASTITVTGDNSYGIHILSGVTVEGPLLLDGGAITVTSSTTTAGSPTNVIAAEIDGNLVGNLEINNSGLGESIVGTGPGSRGLVVLGSITGNIFNGGTIEATGSATTPTTTTGNPQGSTAFLLAGSVSGGIYNAGPISSGDGIAQGIIATQGTGPAFVISSTASGTPAPLNIGLYTNPDGTAPADPGYDFYNRGQIGASPVNVDQTTLGMHLIGADGAPVTFQGGTIDSTTYPGGIFNSGRIYASGSTDTNATSGIAVTGMWIDDFVTIPVLENSSAAGTGTGNIIASVSGASPGAATAILINKDSTGHGELDALINSGTIEATASTSDTTISGLSATAILDQSGTLSSITNSGAIEALATTLDNNAQVRIAADLRANTSGVNFQNSGTVIGDIYFGGGGDTLTLSGTGSSVSGDIDFNGGHDTLTIGSTDVVSGAVLEYGGGYADITVGTGLGTGALFVNNTNAKYVSPVDPALSDPTYDHGTLEVGQLDVKSGGTLGISLSQGFNQADNSLNPVLVSANNAPGGTGTINLDSGSFLDVTFGGFVSAPGTEPAKFVLFDAPNGKIAIGNPSAIQDSINGTIPFLFTGNVCAYNIADFTACSGSQSDSQLVLNLTPKSVGTGANQIPLTGYAAQIFPYANAALGTDNTLGAAVIAAGSGITDESVGNTLYQNIYSQFAPDVSGGARQIAISLTDEATSVVGAHQRALRMYAGQNSAATLWGQEFVQRFDAGTNQPNGYRDSGFGFAVGADGGTPSSGRYGGALTFFSGDILEKIPAQVKTSTEWYMFSGYTDWRGKGLFFDSQVTVGYGSLTGRRAIFVDNSTGGTLIARVATDKRASLMAAGGFSTGAVMNMGTLVFMPQFSMDALTLRENGYTETGGGNGFDLSVDPYYAKSLRTYVGGTLREDLKLGGVFLQPEARLGYRYDLLADPVKLRAAFAGDPSAGIPAGSVFTLNGPDPAKGSLVVGAGLAATTGNWSIGFGYDLLSGGGITQHTGTFTLVGRI